MPSASCHCDRYVLKAESTSGRPQPEFVVHHIVQRLVQIAQLLENPPAKENVGLRDVVHAAQQDFPIEVDLLLGKQSLSGLIDDQVIAVDEIHQRILLKGLGDRSKATGFVNVVGV